MSDRTEQLFAEPVALQRRGGMAHGRVTTDANGAATRWLGVVMLCAGIACGTDAPAPVDSVASLPKPIAAVPVPVPAKDSASAPMPRVLASAPAADWAEYRGEGFSVRYPADAVIDTGTSRDDNLPYTEVVGPETSFLYPGSTSPRTGPAYRIVFTSLALDADSTVDAWVEDQRHATNSAIGSDPADSLDFLEKPTVQMVGGQRGLVLQPFCGDCSREDVYVMGPRRRLVISINYDPSTPGDDKAQRRLYDAIMSTVRWTP